MSNPIAPTVPGSVPLEVEQATRQVAASASRLARHRAAWRGDSRAAYLSKDARDSLDGTLQRLGVNYPRMAVGALADRMTLAGLELTGSKVWAAFVRARGRELAQLVHTDRLLYGTAYVTAWATESGTPTLTGDSPLTMTHKADPATGRTLWAGRVWDSLEDERTTVIYTPDTVTTYRGGLGGGGWRHHSTIDNPLAAVPVVPMVRRVSLSDPLTGASVVEDILDLTDAVSKVLLDAMVTSEYYARPRRWATGLEIEEDEDGRPVDPFGSGRFLQSEDPDTRFGQLDAARLDGHSDLLATLTQSIGAISGLPAHFLGLHGDQPPSADGIRSAEAQLVARARGEQAQTTDEWGAVAVLLDAVARGVPVDPAREGTAVVTWENPETSTPAMSADAAAKLRGMGVPLETVLERVLDYSPVDAKRVADLARTEAVLGAMGRPR